MPACACPTTRFGSPSHCTSTRRSCPRPSRAGGAPKHSRLLREALACDMNGHRMRAWVVGACLFSASVVAEGAPSRAVPDKESQDEETLSRPERQWRWIREATDDTCREQLAQTKAKFHPLRDRERPDAK